MGRLRHRLDGQTGDGGALSVITLDCEQGTREWIEARLGIPTATGFSRIVTPGGKISKSREAYWGDLLAEWVLQEPQDDVPNLYWIERGEALEPEARRYYSFHADVDAVTVGFVFRDALKTVGCSPDGLVGEDGLLELKCPKAGHHIAWLARGVVPQEHISQLQGQLWVTGRHWVDFMSYHPGLPPFIIRVEPEPRYQDALDEHIPTFCDEVVNGRAYLQSLGVGLEPGCEVPPPSGSAPSFEMAKPKPSMSGVRQAAEAAFTRQISPKEAADLLEKMK